jgi:hypothetical protein
MCGGAPGFLPQTMTFSLAGGYTYGCRAQLLVDGGRKGSEADGVYDWLVEAPDGVKLLLVLSCGECVHGDRNDADNLVPAR